MGKIASMFENIFFPEYDFCIFCNSERNLVSSNCCTDCAKKLLPANPFAVHGFTALCAYEFMPPVSTAVHNYKYNDNGYLANFFAKQLFEAYTSHGFQCNTVTWVALHRRKRQARGFDQAELLANAFAKLTHLPLEGLIHRKKFTATQTKFNAQERLQNVVDVFEVQGDVAGKSIALVDDVITTGATITTCAQLLREAGAKDVLCLAFAHA